MKRFLSVILKYFIDDIINLCAFIIIIFGAFIIALNIENARTVMVLIGLMVVAVLVISTYVSYLYYKKKE